MASEQCILPAGGPLSLTGLCGLVLLEVPAKEHTHLPCASGRTCSKITRNWPIEGDRRRRPYTFYLGVLVIIHRVEWSLFMKNTHKWRYCSAPVELGWFEDGGKMFWDERRVFRGV